MKTDSIFRRIPAIDSIVATLGIDELKRTLFDYDYDDDNDLKLANFGHS